MKYNCENCIHYGKGGVLNRSKKCANCQVDIKNHEVVGKPSNYEERAKNGWKYASSVVLLQ